MVHRAEEREHNLFSRVRNAEYARQKQEQSVRKAQQELYEVKRQNAQKIKEEMSQLTKQEQELEQKLIREQAQLAKVSYSFSHWTTPRTIPRLTVICGALHTALRPFHWCHWLLIAISSVSLHISFLVSRSVNIPSECSYVVQGKVKFSVIFFCLFIVGGSYRMMYWDRHEGSPSPTPSCRMDQSVRMSSSFWQKGSDKKEPPPPPPPPPPGAGKGTRGMVSAHPTGRLSC